MIQLFNNHGFKWISQNGIWFKGHLFKVTELKPDDEIIKELELLDGLNDFKKYLKTTNGCFSVVIEENGFVLASVDTIRSFPCFILY